MRTILPLALSITAAAAPGPARHGLRGLAKESGRAKGEDIEELLDTILRREGKGESTIFEVKKGGGGDEVVIFQLDENDEDKLIAELMRRKRGRTGNAPMKGSRGKRKSGRKPNAAVKWAKKKRVDGKKDPIGRKSGPEDLGGDVSGTLPTLPVYDVSDQCIMCM